MLVCYCVMDIPGMEAGFIYINGSFVFKSEDSYPDHLGDNVVTCYPATGLNDYLVLCEPDCIAFGGGYPFH